MLDPVLGGILPVSRPKGQKRAISRESQWADY
jgi:hypothetical protein